MADLTREQIQWEIGDASVSPSQALLIMNLGNDAVKAGNLRRLGYYTGTNASYNLNALEETGYLRRSNVKGDRRQKLVSLTDKGLDLCIRLRRKLSVKEREAA
jgi:DNA-binding MarR family transcriptional regulator